MADHPILQAMRRVTGLADTLADTVWPCRLTCTCGVVRLPTREQVASYFAGGWPQCCGHTMTMVRIDAPGGTRG